MIVLDTHAWLWWVSEPGRLSPAARKAIDGADAIGVSTLSGWEVAMLVQKGRISLDRDVDVWVRQALAFDRITVLPPPADVTVAAALLDAQGFPRDFAGRFIYATARALRAPLVTARPAIRAFDDRLTVW